MPSLQDAVWYQSLNQPLAAAYLVFGAEDLLRLEAVDALRQAAKREGYFDRRVLHIDSGFDWSLLHEAAQAMGLFAERTFIEIHLPSGKPGKEGGEALLQAAQTLLPDTVLLLVLPAMDKSQQKAKWFQAWLQAAATLECRPVSNQQLPHWIKQRLQGHGLTASAEAIEVLAARVEGNLLAAKQEIDKLALLYPEHGHIGVDDAQQAVADVARFDVFDLAESWMLGKTERVVHLLAGLQATGEEPVLLLWALCEDLRALLRLKAALSQGESEPQIRRRLRLWGDKFIWAQRALQRLSTKKILAALQQCAVVDRQIKGAEVGDAWRSVQTLVLDLATGR